MTHLAVSMLRERQTAVKRGASIHSSLRPVLARIYRVWRPGARKNTARAVY